MLFPCHAVPLRDWNVSFPFDLHSAAVCDSHLPFHAHAMLRPCRSSQGHSTAVSTARHGHGMLCVNRLLVTRIVTLLLYATLKHVALTVLPVRRRN